MKYYTDNSMKKGGHRRLRGWIIAIATVIVIIWLIGFFFGDSEGKSETMSAIEENTALKQQVQSLMEENAELITRVNELEESAALAVTPTPIVPEAPAGVDVTPVPTQKPTASPRPTATPKASRSSSTPTAEAERD